jgi:hypothetical protein
MTYKSIVMLAAYVSKQKKKNVNIFCKPSISTYTKVYNLCQVLFLIIEDQGALYLTIQFS